MPENPDHFCITSDEKTAKKLSVDERFDRIEKMLKKLNTLILMQKPVPRPLVLNALDKKPDEGRLDRLENQFKALFKVFEKFENPPRRVRKTILD